MQHIGSALPVECHTMLKDWQAACWATHLSAGCVARRFYLKAAAAVCLSCGSPRLRHCLSLVCRRHVMHQGMHTLAKRREHALQGTLPAHNN